MKMSGNTILITGGGSGIGRALAEALHQCGNQVIVAGRRREALAEVIAANPGMEARALDMADPQSITALAAELATSHPNLNVLVNNAGIMFADDPTQPLDDDMLTGIVAVIC